MRKILFSRWTMSAIGIALLGILVWVFAPLIAELEPWLPRAAIVVGLIAAWAIVNFLIDRRGKAQDRALAEGVAQADSSAEASAEEAAALRDRLSRAGPRRRNRCGPNHVHDIDHGD